METIDPYKTTNGYSQPTMTPPPTASNESPDFEGIGRLYIQNEQLKKRIEELEEKTAEETAYKQRYYDKCEECDDVKNENKLLKEENRLLEQKLNDGVPRSGFLYNFDVMDFNDNMGYKDIERLMDICLELAETPLPKGYLIEDSMDVVPLYILLAERNAFRKRGDSDKDTRNWGLTAFCECWNNNVIPRIADEKRKDELRCDSKKIKGELNRDLWKNSASCSWNGLYARCDNGNGRNSKKKAKLGRAVNIQKRMDKLLEQIPALKIKKY